MSKTVSQAIIKWLHGFESISIDEDIDTNQLQAMANAYGLYKTPQTVVIPYVDGTRDVTAYYLFMARQRAQSETERKNSEGWLETLESWVLRQNRERNLPVLEIGLACQSIRVANVPSMQYLESGEAVFQLTISINYIDERMKNNG